MDAPQATRDPVAGQEHNVQSNENGQKQRLNHISATSSQSATNHDTIDAETSDEEDETDNMTPAEKEREVLTIGCSAAIMEALKKYLSDEKPRVSSIKHGSLASMTNNPWKLRLEFARGLKTILKACCDKRLETFHGVMAYLKEEGKHSTVINWVVLEAHGLQSEVEEADKLVLVEIFGESSLV